MLVNNLVSSHLQSMNNSTYIVSALLAVLLAINPCLYRDQEFNVSLKISLTNCPTIFIMRYKYVGGFRLDAVFAYCFSETNNTWSIKTEQTFFKVKILVIVGCRLKYTNIYIYLNQIIFFSVLGILWNHSEAKDFIIIYLCRYQN